MVGIREEDQNKYRDETKTKKGVPAVKKKENQIPGSSQPLNTATEDEYLDAQIGKNGITIRGKGPVAVTAASRICCTLIIVLVIMAIAMVVFKGYKSHVITTGSSETNVSTTDRANILVNPQE